MVSDCNGSKSAVELWLQSTSSTHFGERSNAGAILLTGQSSDRVFWGYSLSQRRPLDLNQHHTTKYPKACHDAQVQQEDRYLRPRYTRWLAYGIRRSGYWRRLAVLILLRTKTNHQ